MFLFDKFLTWSILELSKRTVRMEESRKDTRDVKTSGVNR